MPLPLLPALAMAALFGNFNLAASNHPIPLSLSSQTPSVQPCENCIILDRTEEKQVSFMYKKIKLEADHIRINRTTNKGIAWGDAKMQVEGSELMISAEKVEF